MSRGLQAIDFQGEWVLERVIEDFRAGATSTFVGRATLAPEASALNYEETGELHTANGSSLKASRRYLWQETPNGIDVSFDDGRFFHAFNHREATPKSEHFCDPDQYNVTYDFTDWPCWKATWQVTGPRKDYVMTSTYKPA